MCAKVKLRLQKEPNKPNKTRTKFDIQKLKKEDVLNAFTIELKNRYQPVLEDETPTVLDEDEIERDYQVLEKAFTEVADEVLARPKKKRKPWISEQSWLFVDQREELNKKILSTRSERVKKRLRMEYKEKNRVVKRSIRCDKRKWMDNIASEAEDCARKQHMSTLYGLTKVLTVQGKIAEQCSNPR